MLFRVGSLVKHLIVPAFFWIPRTLVDLFLSEKDRRQAPWRPSFAVNGSVVAGDFRADGLLSLEMPCGTLDAEAPRKWIRAARS